MNAAAELRGISKTFPGVRALHEVTLAIAPGEVLGLVGENGAGKSTLVKILSGVYPAGTYAGQILVGGQPRAFHSVRAARAAGIAVVHQELALVPEMTVAENLLLGREPARWGLVDAARAEATAKALLETVLGADARALPLDVPVGQLGVGVQQLLEIARALADDARVIVLDEPTAALTAGEIDRLFGLVRARRAAGAAFVYISHRLEEIAALCDRVAIMRDGELVEVVAGAASPDRIVEGMTGKQLGDVHTRASHRVIATDAVPVLAVEHLAVGHPSLPGRRVVDDLSFRVHAGEVVALAGAMGSGRTATLSALFGIARTRVTGTIRVDGEAVAIGSPRDAIAARIALVPEDRKGAGLVLGLSVADNLGLATLASGSPFGLVDEARAELAARARATELAIKMPVADGSAEVATLSGGNQQKVVLGKWLALAPRVLLLDEPTRGVDVGAKVEIYRLVEALAAAGHGVVLASSDLPEVIRLADRVLVLREGVLAGELVGAAITPLAIMQLAVGAATQADRPAVEHPALATGPRPRPREGARA